MTVYEIPNINHCTVEEMASGRMYRVTANEGWYIHLNNGIEETENVWKTVVILNATIDMSIVQIVPASELPEGAEIWAVGNETVTE